MKAYRTLDPTLLTEFQHSGKLFSQSLGGKRHTACVAGSGRGGLTQDGMLLEAFREGSTPVLTMIYTKYAPIIAGFLARGFSFQSKGGTAWFKGFREPYDLENCLQETFARAFAEPARRSYNGVTSYLNYLLAIARNIVIDESRRRDPVLDARTVELGEPLLKSDCVWGDLPESPEHRLLIKELGGLWLQFKRTLTPGEFAYAEARFDRAQVRKVAAKSCSLSLMQARTLEHRIQRLFLKHMQEHQYLENYQFRNVSCLANQPSPT